MILRILILALLPLAVFADDLAKGEKETIFIGPLQVKPSVTALAKEQNHDADLQKVIDALDSQFVHSLTATRIFELVDRKRLDDLVTEQKFAAGNVDPNDKNIAQGAKMAGAKFVFQPEIFEFEDRTTAAKSSTKKFGFINKSVTTTKAAVRSIYLSVTVQITDTTSGKILPDAPIVSVDNSMLTGDATGGRLYVELANLAATRLAQNAVSLMRPPKVLDVTGDQIMINRGIESGFPVDTEIELYAIKEVKDEDSGETFRSEIPVGKAKIVRGDAKQSFATIVGDNLGIAAGCVARPLKAKVEKKVVAASTTKAKKKAPAKEAKAATKEQDW
jgi:Curli production assembly/transport component CsgG